MNRTLMMASCMVAVSMASAAYGQEREIPVTFRDFTGTGTTAANSNPPSTHPDFEFLDAYCWNVNNVAPVSVTIPFIGTIQICGLDIGPQPEEDIVATLLGVDGKPVYVGGGGFTTNGATEFASWYNDDATYNTTVPGTIIVTDDGTGSFVFQSGAFFPMDGLGFGNTIREKNELPDCLSAEWLCNCSDDPFTPEQDCPVIVSNEAHNWHFTMEMHSQFTYLGGEVFDYTGDDDLWVFIDGKLVIDIGGVHNPVNRSIALDTLTDVDGGAVTLVPGQNYDFDLFFAERHRNESNFLMTTSILLGTERCPGNVVSTDSVVNVVDLLELLGAWGDCPLPCNLGSANAPDTCPADTNRDCTVNVVDLLNLLGVWGPCP